MRVLGPTTAFLVGLGVAIGSGIFRTPALVAQELGSPAWILGAWAFGGVFVFLSGLVSAELATRYPEAGGEYVYLREAYGDFVAFFFGWGYSVFIIGGGAATIAAAAGEAGAELIGLDPGWARPLAALAVIGVVGINALGVKAGAGLQNALTGVKVLALVAVVVAAVLFGHAPTAWDRPLMLPEGRSLAAVLVAALPPVLWAYEGTTDAVKLAEEVEDPQRALPRALLGSALTLTVLYVGANAAYLAVLTPEQIAGSRFAANDVMAALFGPGGRRLMTALSLVVFLGALSATILATVRVTFALARDGLTFPIMARMSKAQAPVPALVAVGGIATLFTLARGFQQILNIYFLAAAVLFGLAYGSLIVFRRREARAGRVQGIFRCPAGPAVATALIGLQVAMAGLIITESPTDSLYTLLLLGAVAALYGVWRRSGLGGAAAAARRGSAA
jgi:APA family basic amino acid/polyamine antiporter